MIVAIDGPAGAGKSTVASALAEALGVERLDTGAMYRSVALAALGQGVDLSDGPALAALAAGLDLEMAAGRVRLGGVDVTAELRAAEVTRAAPAVAAHGGVRAHLVAHQRAWLADRPGAVVEGRDIATVVCPDADLKVYLTATPAERSRRRAAEMPAAGEASLVAAELAQRDHDDSTRAASPLSVAPGAVVIDTTGRSVDDLVAELIELTRPPAGARAEPEPATPAPAEPAQPAPAEPAPVRPAAAKPALGRARVVPPTRAARAFYALARAVLMGLEKLLWRASVEGTERVPATGAVIVSPVHRSNIDTILMALVTRRRLCYLAKDSLWSSAPLGLLVSALGGFPVRRGAGDGEALRQCTEILGSGQSLVVFPEGTRRSGPVVENLHRGAAYLSLRTGAPIVPVGIGGSEGALPKGSRRPRRVAVHVVIGHPLVPAPRSPGSNRVPRAAVDQLTARLAQELQGLFDQAQAVALARMRGRR